MCIYVLINSTDWNMNKAHSLMWELIQERTDPMDGEWLQPELGFVMMASRKESSVCGLIYPLELSAQCHEALN